MEGLFGGQIVAIIAGGYRLFLGGVGIYVGTSIVIVSTCLGLVYRYGVQKGWVKINVSQLLLFGLLVHLLHILLYTQLPALIAAKAMATIAIPLFLNFYWLRHYWAYY